MPPTVLIDWHRTDPPDETEHCGATMWSSACRETAIHFLMGCCSV